MDERPGDNGARDGSAVLQRLRRGGRDCVRELGRRTERSERVGQVGGQAGVLEGLGHVVGRHETVDGVAQHGRGRLLAERRRP
jgi:hypothetical protein